MGPLFLTCLCSQKDLLVPRSTMDACGLIALDKQPGIRPIDRIISMIVGIDIQETMGCLQLCGGQISGEQDLPLSQRNVRLHYLLMH